jgi:hypothetical protein
MNVKSSVSVEEGAQNIGHGLMKAFNHRIGLWVLDSSGNIFNSIGLKDALKVRANEFFALVMDAMEWSRVSREPFLFKLPGNMRRLGVVNGNDFKEVGQRINACENMKHGFATLVKLEGPWASQVNGNIVPWIGRKFFFW